MAEEQEKKSVDDLLKQIEEFEKTIQGLAGSVQTLKQRLLKNKEAYGSDISKWPKEAK